MIIEVTVYKPDGSFRVVQKEVPDNWYADSGTEGPEAAQEGNRQRYKHIE